MNDSLAKTRGKSLAFALRWLELLRGALLWMLLRVPRPFTPVPEWVRSRRRHLDPSALPRDAMATEVTPPLTRAIATIPPGAGDLFSVFAAEAVQAFDAVWVARVRDAYAAYGCVIAPDGTSLSAAATARPIPRRPPILPGTYLSLVDRWADGYAHWILDVLPRLLVYGDLVAAGVPVLVNGPLRRWQRDTLELAGVSADHVVELAGPVRVRTLYLADGLGTPGNCHPEALAWLRRTFSGRTGQPIRLFVSRSSAPRRRIVNEAPLCSALEARGFVVARLEELTFEEQVDLFSNAEVVVAPHGAGLANLAFVPAHCRVVELMPVGYPQLGYWALASMAYLRYDVVVCGTVPGDRLRSEELDIEVDVAAVIATVDQLVTDG